MAERPLRLALIEPAGRGGIGHYTRGLAAALARKSTAAAPIEVTLLTAREYEFAGLELPFRVERVFDRWGTSPSEVLATLRRLQPDVIHLQGGTHPALHVGLALAAKAVVRAPLVVTAHEITPKNSSGLAALAALACRGLYRIADRIVVLGEAPEREMIARFPATRGRVSVVPHGEYGFLAPPRTPRARSASRARARASEPPMLLFFGQLHEDKGLADLIEALPAVARARPDVQLVIAGKPELEVEPLRERAEQLGVGAAIDWRLRWIEDDERDELFKRSTAVVLPYRRAAQSGVAFLAGAFERPLVATRVGALPELIEDERSGLLCEPRDPASLAAALVRMLADGAAARRRGHEHARRCRDHGCWTAIAERTTALYSELVPTWPGTPKRADERPKRARLPLVTVVMPVRNEEATITTAIGSLLAQRYPRRKVELLVVDGRSTDRTRARVRALAKKDRRILLLDNPGRIVSTALNLGFLRARGSVVARADGHTRYAPDYLLAAMRALERTGADVVGGAMVAKGRTPFERAVARALGSPFGMGGANFHRADLRAGASGPADAVYLGVFRADALHKFGGFDEHLVRNQDDEWFARARARGARIHLDGSIRSRYRPRSSARRLFRQYFEYGRFKPAALRKVAGSFRRRHAAPSALLLALLLPPLLGLPLVALAAALAYTTALVFASRTLLDAAVFALMHAGYGLGFLAGALRRVPDDSHAAVRATYSRYRGDARKRRDWSDLDRGQAALLAERDRALAQRLLGHFFPRAFPRTGRLRILDLGSGERDLAEVLERNGIAGARVVAVDLLSERLARHGGRARAVADGRLLPFADASFDAVIQCTLLSSLRATSGRRLVAAEMVRVCRPGGLVLSYDARLPNPFNPHVRRLSRREHRDLFDGCGIEFEPLTVLPPLARLLPSLAPQMGRVAALRAFDLAAIEPMNGQGPR